MKYHLLESDSAWVAQTLASVLRKVKAEVARNGPALPFFPVEGRYRDCMMPAGLWWWTNGFWPGLLWQAYHATGEDVYREAARATTARLITTLARPEKLDHDVGFLFELSAVAEYRQTGSPEARAAALQAAELLAGRFNEAGGFLRAWETSPWAADVSGWMIVDCMMNLSLLFWAGEETGEVRYKEIATRHAHTARRYLLRADGSCAHIAAFDALTGDFKSNPAGQGYAEKSAWGRGQGWALYGFALACRHTGEDAFLQAAKRSAHYAIAALSAQSWLSLVDFRAPQSPMKYDSGAGVIIACGLLELARQLPALEQPLYVDAALKILKACTAQFAALDPGTDGILQGGRTMYHDERLANLAFVYGDYFYLEALLRLTGQDFFIW